MIVLDHPLGERQTKPPPSFTGSKPGLENCLKIGAGNSFSRIMDINKDLLFGNIFGDLHFDTTSRVDGIGSVLQDIFQYPVEQGNIELRFNVLVAPDLEVDFVAYTNLEIIDKILNDLIEVVLLQNRL